MGSGPKIIGLMSCVFLLCLGLSNAAQAMDTDDTHMRQPGGPRVGGQGGERDLAPPVEEKEADAPHERQPGGPRVGGQSGQR